MIVAPILHSFMFVS